MSFVPRSRRGLVLGLLVAVAVAGAALAYWTAGGSGTGSASAGTTAPITAVQTSTLTPMYPGDSPQTLSGTFTNTNSGPVYVSSVTASIGSVSNAGCDATDFTLANATMTVNAQVPAGTSQGSWSGATIKFNNKAGANQDACKNATVTLNYVIS
ncbi:MAG: hypothetical protein QOI80_3689 [Solirubrobacteraceae bacterium]|jgi:hypothetical protein|nr:hypothetical protein [Solirubrobacteraceae bacterium]